MDKTTFDKGMALLIGAFPGHQCSPESLAIYAEALRREDITDAEFEAMVWGCITSCKFFPTVAELLAQLFRPTAEKSFQRLIEAAEQGITPVLNDMEEAALAVLGGWDRFQFTSYDELRRHFREFKGVFEAAGQGQGKRRLRLLEGGK